MTPVVVPFAILLGADAAFDHWVHELQMARVEGQRHVHVVAARRLAIERVAEVVLHVAGADVLLRVVILEPCEDLPHVHFHDVDHHVEAPAVRHADDHFLDAQLGGALGEDVQHGDHAFAAFEREALGAGVLRVQELLEDLGVGELGEDANLLLATEVDVVSGQLHAVAEPIARLPVLEEGELDADRSRVRVFQACQNRAQRFVRRPCQVARREDGVRVDMGEPVALQNELFSGRLTMQAQRIQVGEEMTAHAVRVDQRGETGLQLVGCEQLGRRRERRADVGEDGLERRFRGGWQEHGVPNATLDLGAVDERDGAWRRRCG